MMHFRRDKASELLGASEPTTKTPSREALTIGLIVLAVVLLSGFLCGVLFGGVTGQVYVLGSVATLAKTFAWWIGQYPFMKNKSLLAKWFAGWSIAGIFEYLPLIGAMSMGQRHGINQRCSLLTWKQWIIGSVIYKCDLSESLFTGMMLRPILEWPHSLCLVEFRVIITGERYINDDSEKVLSSVSAMGRDVEAA